MKKNDQSDNESSHESPRDSKGSLYAKSRKKKQSSRSVSAIPLGGIS